MSTREDLKLKTVHGAHETTKAPWKSPRTNYIKAIMNNPVLYIEAMGGYTPSLRKEETGPASIKKQE